MGIVKGAESGQEALNSLRRGAVLRVPCESENCSSLRGGRGPIIVLNALNKTHLPEVCEGSSSDVLCECGLLIVCCKRILALRLRCHCFGVGSTVVAQGERVHILYAVLMFSHGRCQEPTTSSLAIGCTSWGLMGVVVEQKLGGAEVPPSSPRLRESNNVTGGALVDVYNNKAL